MSVRDGNCVWEAKLQAVTTSGGSSEAIGLDATNLNDTNYNS